jgi:hypothetical protein
VIAIEGSDDEVVAAMITDMARYLAGPGLPGFHAWLEQANCDCGTLHPVLVDSLRKNLEILAAKFKQAVA